jgi:hypothetical protein
MSLPRDPGLQRRLAYGDLIRRRNNASESIEIEIEIFEQLVNLPNVKVGARLKDIIERTHLHICVEKTLCVICQDETSPIFDVVRRLSCQHTYHAKCIDTWFVESDKCPLCNVSISKKVEYQQSRI